MASPDHALPSVATARRPTTIGTLPRLTLAAGEWAVLRWLLPLALLHGLLYLAILPPWQHYDEPAHFIYATEIAVGEASAPGPISAERSIEIADSMYRFRFFGPGLRPDLLSPGAMSLGENQRVHPPLYHMIAAVPLRWLSALAVEQQLYIVRVLSLIFYVLTIVTAWRIAVALVPDEPLMQALIPLLVMLTPAFVDLMTAVNSDVLLNFSVTVALLGAVLLVRDGLGPLSLALVILGMAVAALTKRTAMGAAIPLAVAMLWSVHRTRLRWWGVPLIAIAAVVVLGFAIFEPVVIDGPSGSHTILAARPWFAAIANGYLRLNFDALARSISDPDLIGGRYQALLQVGFESFWAHFAWGQIKLHQAWILVMTALSAVATVGLILGGLRSRDELPLWQQRCIWLFMIAVVVAWVSLFIRIHPLPPPDVVIYIPRGRYIFWAIVPTIWLLALGLARITPLAYRRATLYALVGFFACLDIAAWLWTITGYYYR
ncbi:MAG: hypothetical protein HGA45_16390 [Chloroflexales bacterium]|nr:hypothetical protein [Chloroflexales bacterium]